MKRKILIAAIVMLAASHAPDAAAQNAPAASAAPLTLEQAVARAIENNPALKAAEDAAAGAQARVGQVRAAWYPRIDFVQGFTRGNNPVYVFGTLLTQRRFTTANFAIPFLNAPTPLDNFQTRFTGAVNLFDTFRTPLRVASARRMSSAADFATEQARQDLILRVVRGWWDVVVARANVDASRESLSTAEANLERVRALEKAGLVVTSDLLSAQVFRAQMKEREIRAANALELARLALAREIGSDAASLGEPEATLSEPGAQVKPAEEWERAALASRPALRAAEMEREAAQKGSKLAKAEFGPKLGLFADVERDAFTLAGPSGTNWTAGVQFEVNVFAGGADRYRLAEAQARERQAEHQLEWFRSGVKLEVRQAYLETLAAAERAAAARDAVAQAREGLRIIQNRYEAGLTTITELLRAQTAQLDARTGYLAALHDWHVARAQLERAAGSLAKDSAILRGAAGGNAAGADAQ